MRLLKTLYWLLLLLGMLGLIVMPWDEMVGTILFGLGMATVITKAIFIGV